MIEDLDNLKPESEDEEVETLVDFLESEEGEETEPEPVEVEPVKKVQNGSESFKVKAQSMHVIVHSDTSVYSRKITRLNAGNQMTVLEELGDWYRVSLKHSGETINGYVRAKTVTRI